MNQQTENPIVTFTTRTKTNRGIRCKIRGGILSEIGRHIRVKGKIYNPVVIGLVQWMQRYRNSKQYQSSDRIRDFLKENGIGIRQESGRTLAIYSPEDSCGEFV